MFHEQGYHATGVATILREAGVNSGSLYHFFPSKDDLLLGVLNWCVENLHSQVIDPAAARAADPIDRVFALLALYREGMDMFHCKMGCPVGNLALEVADDHPGARELIDLNFRNWARAVQKWLDDAGDCLPPDVDRNQLAHFVLTVMEGGIMQARAAGNLAPFDSSVAQLRAYIDRLLADAARLRKPRPRRRNEPAPSPPHPLTSQSRRGDPSPPHSRAAAARRPRRRPA